MDRTTERVGTLVLGAGRSGIRRARCATAHRWAQLVTLQDPDPGRAAAAAGEGAVPTTSLDDAALRGVGLAVVSDAAFAHAPDPARLVDLLERGVHLLLDGPEPAAEGPQPLPTDPADLQPSPWQDAEVLDRLAAAARRAERIVKIGTRLRHRIAVQRALDHVLDGNVGAATSFAGAFTTAAACVDPLGALGLPLLDAALDVLGPARTVRCRRTGDGEWQLETAHAPGRGGAAAALSRIRCGSGSRDLFEFEVRGETGGVAVEGLGSGFFRDDDDFGVETLFYMQEPKRPGRPAERTRTPHEMADGSFDMDFDEMVASCLEDRAPVFGNLDRARELAALLRLARTSLREDRTLEVPTAEA